MIMSCLSFSFGLSVLLFYFVFSSSSTLSLHDDRPSLLAFKKLITSDPNQSMANWLPAVPLCNWTAITCSRRHPLDRVVSIDLESMDLRGPISPALGNLSLLRSLVLSNNSLYGHIPPQLGKLFRLKKLRLSYNQLEGTIPSQLGGCRNLSYLALSYNNLSGTIPPELGSLAHLQQLYLTSNTLIGNIPTSLGNLSALIVLDFTYNNLSGAIPPQLGLLPRLLGLFLYYNELSGNIPTSLANISTLNDLHLSGNFLNGSIPQELGLLTSLQTFSLAQNELSGTIPNSFGNLFNLIALRLWGNQLIGPIPKFIGNCSKLEVLSLEVNKLTGNVPIELGKLSFLEILHLNDNQLKSGSITTIPVLIALTNCSNLQGLHLDNNRLSGVLRLDIGKLSTNLSYLSLSANRIEGCIPPHIGNLSSLNFLDLSGNLLSGNIPSLRNLEKLERLYLGNNKLEGNIPDEFEQLQRLGLLDISRNILSGKIPRTLAHLKQFRRLILHHNQLSGSIPTNLGDCINLELVDLSHNKLNERIPPEISKLSNLQFYLNLSWNLLEGSLPLEISKITMVQAIDISSNKLTGVIPSSLGSCNVLQSLNLSRNSFQGSIPDSLKMLQNLVNLDLSCNYLSGTIPVTLKKLKTLQYLNLSFNNLTGEIPEEGFLENQTMNISLIGNLGLCGPQIFGLHACPTLRGYSTIVRKVIFSLIGTIAFIICCLFLRFLWRRNMHVHVQNFTIFRRLEFPRISYQELHIATNGFIQDNLLGTGSFGSVYKGILSDGTLIAVKVLQLQKDQADKSFKIECNVLQKVRHQNLVKIVTSCSNLYFKALVFEFMSNGSLEKHLYPDRCNNNGDDVCELGLKSRLEIAIDVAYGIEYLHHDSFVQIVHCDIKPNNVLLGEDMLGHVTDFGIARLIEDMLGHVTDFGIARLIGEGSSDSLTSTLALKGTVGYIAPEYGLGNTVSTQGDVYSYGILLLEMLTRKKPVSDMFVKELNLHKWVNLAFPNTLKGVIDNSLLNEMEGDQIEENNIYKCLVPLLRVGLLCSKDSPQERPTMRAVVTMLKSIREDFMGNTVAAHGLGGSISNFLNNENARSNDMPALDDESSTF